MPNKTDEFLSHYGILGMRWGKRKPGTGEPSKHVSEDSAKASEAHQRLKSNGIQSLTNQDLRQLNDRLQLEQKYSELVSKKAENASNFKKFTKGKDRVDKILAIGATINTVMSFVNSDAGKAMKSGLSKLRK